MKIRPILAILYLLAVGIGIPCAQAAAEPSITVEADKSAGTVSPLLYGLMTEEINHSYDGGLYAELVRNRAFLDDASAPAHWSVVTADGASATIELDRNEPVNAALPVSLRLGAASASDASPAGIANEGYWGIPAFSKTRYNASFYAKAAPGFSGKIVVSIQSEDGKTIYAKSEVKGVGQTWTQYHVSLKTGKLAAPVKARYVLAVDRPGTVWFSLVSLFPPTWKDRPNGLRKDLMQMLVDMKPRFLRFPGGNYMEGDTIETRFDWRKTIGPVSERAGKMGPWKYRSSDGMGLMEFLLWCEDMGTEPVLGLYAGYSLKEPAVKLGAELAPFVQEALDEIEYVSGPVTTQWGAQRAKDGHPKPFKLRYVEIGNEDFFDRSGSYDGRFAQFYDAIKTKHPELQCISSIGVSDHPVKGLLSSRTPDLMDIHFYRSTDEFLKKITEFDTRFDRKGPKVMIGEWAAHEDGRIKPWSKEALGQPPTPSMKAAIGDAACMAAMERNSDIIAMHCYAPLFANVNPGAWQWRPNLIGYDALRAYGSPSYYAFVMFSGNLGDQILPLTKTDFPVQVSATRDNPTGEIFLKLVNPQAGEQPVKIELRGLASVAPEATAITLAANPEDTNSVEEPTKVVPKRSLVSGIKPEFSYLIPANAIVVLKLKAR
ncbi:MAG: alpha-N-arabinofuranosidase [Verrucomicrobia bacterium]|nr:alpha-N-arabinofuranosidase [Verrucomicrobiota bacterium]